MTYGTDTILSLISRIHSQSQDFIEKKLENAGLSKMASSHGNILYSLSKCASMSPGELAKKINRDKSTTTVLVRKLEKEGFVKIQKDKADCRKKNILLSEKGKIFNERTEAISKEFISSCFKDFSDEEKKSLLLSLDKIRVNLEEKDSSAQKFR